MDIVIRTVCEHGSVWISDIVHAYNKLIKAFI